MGNGLKKRYVILIIALVVILVFSSITILVRLGISSYEKFMLNDRVKFNDTDVISQDIEEKEVYREKEDSEEFKSNLYSFWDEGYYGFKNSYGEVVIEPKYYYVENFSEDLAVVSMDYDYGYIYSNESLAINNEYSFAKSFKNGLAIVEFEDNSEGVIDKEGNELFKTLDYDIYDIIGDNILVRDKSSEDYKIGFLNKKGEKITDIKYDDIGEFKYGYAKVSSDSKYGFINEDGEEVVPLNYDSITEFAEGYAVLSEDGNDKVIDTKLKEIVIKNIDFDSSYDGFINGVIIGTDSNTLEKVVFDKEFNELFRVPWNYYFSGVSKGDTIIFNEVNYENQTLIFIDFNGNIKFEIKNAYIDDENIDVKDDYFIIRESGFNDKYGVIDSDGNEVIPFKYSNIRVKDKFFICIKESLFKDKVDIYYEKNKIANKLKSELINLEGEGVISIDENKKSYYINKYGEKFLKNPGW